MNHGTDTKPADTLSPDLLDVLIEEHRAVNEPRLRKFWDYYRNPARRDSAGGRVRLAQQDGLPTRLTKPDTGDTLGREVVIENDIAWRMQSLVNFMFGKPLVIQSTAADSGRAKVIQRFLREVFKANGGERFFQDLGLLGSIYGYVDVLIRADDLASAQTDPSGSSQIMLETVEAPRAIPILSPQDYRQLDAYALHFRQTGPQVEQNHFLSRVRNRVLGGAGRRQRAVTEHTQVWTDQTYQRFQANPGALGGGRKLVEESINRLGRIPIVHIQNLSQPFFYEGLSEVEPLIPLQDELNTRLSDRANRVTFQSFKMYLGKGIEHFTDRPVGPGQMWATDNPDASITEFGGDSGTPSEDAHISEIREAMDKTSTVSPLATGLLRAKVGNLSSENALRIVMMGMLAKIEKKRLTYGEGVEQICELILHAADIHGIFPSTPKERGVRIDWAEPLPDTDSQLLRNALLKLEVGVSKDQVLTELGYGDQATAQAQPQTQTD
jgi:Phage portal protein, SPP1 Gp6-like